MTPENAAHRLSLSTPSEWNVTQYQEAESRNGVAWSCTIRRNGAIVARAHDEGVGGMTEIDFDDPAEEAAFVAEETARYGEQGPDRGSMFLNDLATLAQLAGQRSVIYFTDDSDLAWGDMVSLGPRVSLAQAKAALTSPNHSAAGKNPMIFDPRRKIFVAAADIEV